MSDIETQSLVKQAGIGSVLVFNVKQTIVVHIRIRIGEEKKNQQIFYKQHYSMYSK